MYFWAVGDHDLPGQDARVLLDLATKSFWLSRERVDREWHDHLAAISSVARPQGLYRAQRDQSIAEAGKKLGMAIVDDIPAASER